MKQASGSACPGLCALQQTSATVPQDQKGWGKGSDLLKKPSVLSVPLHASWPQAQRSASLELFQLQAGPGGAGLDLHMNQNAAVSSDGHQWQTS